MTTKLRILYNQDSTALFVTTKEPITPEHVDHMVDEVAESGADVLLVNPNAQRVSYPSRVWQTLWEGYTPGDRAFFGSLPEGEIPGRARWLEQMQRLAEGGCDYLARALARCREQGLTPGVSLRMNDMHDQPTPDSYLFSRLYREHPEWHLNNPEISGWSRTGLNYEHPEVRAYFLSLVREMAEAYDFEVLELDFMRFISYFPRRDFARHAAIMTDWLREVRALLATASRPIELLPRVASDPAAAVELGFDAATWAREGLIDGLTTAAFLTTNWDLCVEEFREVTGGEIPIYAGADAMAQRIAGLPERLLPLHPELVRGLAVGYAAAGAAGLNFFNYFTPREEHPPLTPEVSVLGELREPQGLRGRPKTYTVNGEASVTHGGVPETDRPAQLPVVLGERSCRDFRLLMMAEPEATAVTAEIRFTGDPGPEPGQLWLRLNAHAAGSARALETVPDTEQQPVSVARWALPAAALRNGWNRLQLRNEGREITLLGVDLLVNTRR